MVHNQACKTKSPFTLDLTLDAFDIDQMRLEVNWLNSEPAVPPEGQHAERSVNPTYSLAMVINDPDEMYTNDNDDGHLPT